MDYFSFNAFNDEIDDEDRRHVVVEGVVEGPLRVDGEEVEEEVMIAFDSFSLVECQLGHQVFVKGLVQNELICQQKIFVLF